MKLDFMALRSEIVKKICATNDFLTHIMLACRPSSALNDTKSRPSLFGKRGITGILEKIMHKFGQVRDVTC